MSKHADPVLQTGPLGFPMRTFDPFLFCVHHLDHYPPGNGKLAPSVSLAGRRMGMDFSGKDGFSMYHGMDVPGFPQHPHRGFETISIARRGFMDHSDSLGAKARFGKGDVQWMTAGKGIVHSEMFPLLETDKGNTGELFQIWINLPAEDKFADPHFTMLWSESIPRKRFKDPAGKDVELTLVAGSFPGMTSPPSPPPKSWASRPDSDILIATIELAAGAWFKLPAAKKGTSRTLYLINGKGLSIGKHSFDAGNFIRVKADAELELHTDASACEILVLQARPIGEPVAQHGPFVMNNRRELQQAFDDYRRTQFGGWPWKSSAPTHGQEAKRFALHADGRREEPDET